MSTQAPIELDQLSELYDIIGELGAAGAASGDTGKRHPPHQGATSRTLIGIRKSDNAAVLITVATEPAQDANNALSHLAADTNLLATLSHRALLPVVAGHWLGNSAFAVVSQRPSWPSLAATIARDQLPYARVAAILREVNAAIEWSRDKGIVHRSIDAESVFIEPQSDRTLVKFSESVLPAHGTPGRAADAATVARLARLMIGDRQDVPRRLVEETDRVLSTATERGATPDIHEYIALVAMADAVKQGEDHSAETALALEQQRREFDEKIAAERSAHEREMEEQRKQLEHKGDEQEKAHAERLKELERQRKEMEKQFELRVRELEKRQAEQEKQLAAQKRDAERQHQQQQRLLEKERTRFEREMRREREQLRKRQEAMGIAASAMLASTDAHDVEVDVPFTSDSSRSLDVEVPLSDVPPTLDMPVYLEDDAVPATREHALPTAEQSLSAGDASMVARPTQPMHAVTDEHDELVEQPDDVHEKHEHDVVADAAPVPSIWDRKPTRSLWDRLPKANTPIGAAILAVLLIVVLGATVAIVRHNQAPHAAVASRANTGATDSASGNVAAPFGFFALPRSDSLAKLDSAKSDSATALAAAALPAAPTTEATPETSRRERSVSRDSARASDSTGTDSASADTTADPVFTIHPETLSTRPNLVPRDTAQHRPADSATTRPDSAARRDTTSHRD